MSLPESTPSRIIRVNGLLRVAPDHLRVLRIWRDGDVNRVKELDKQRAKEIEADPLMKYSSVMSGVFHKRVIICESDSDCTFYSALLDLPGIRGPEEPDVLFVHANGKHRMMRLAAALKELDVAVDIIGDIDVINDEEVLRRLVRALGADWKEIQRAAKAVRCAVEEQKPWLTATEVKKALLAELESENPELSVLKQRVDTVFRSVSPWDRVKASGRSAIPSGQASQHFNNLRTLCKAVGLWIVPVGQMEGFCRSIGGHGPRWVSEVIENRDLSTDSELQEARTFVHELWAAREHGVQAESCLPQIR